MKAFTDVQKNIVARIAKRSGIIPLLEKKDLNYELKSPYITGIARKYFLGEK